MESNKKLKIYIAGQVSGIDFKEAKNNFKNAEKKLISKGYDVLNPVEIIENYNFYSEKFSGKILNDKDNRLEILGILIKYLIIDADGIFLLKNWEKSDGATLEFSIAKQLNKIVIKDE